MEKINETNIDQLSPGTIIAHSYVIILKVGKGSFGTLYAGYDKKTHEKVAMKFEKVSENSFETLIKEGRILHELSDERNLCPNFLNLIKGSSCNILVMNLLGKNLEHLFKKCQNKFTLPTVCNVAEQMIARIESVHNKGYVHRDLKPENFMVGLHRSDKNIYIGDFGLSKKYLDCEGKHVPFRKKVGMIGTARYTSINSHKGYEQSRRDDLESLFYIFIYLAKSDLPWINVNTSNREEKNKKICELKEKTLGKDLCNGLPKEFLEYYNYIKTLNFEDTPNYIYMKKLFKNCFEANNNNNKKMEFDWILLKKNHLSKSEHNSPEKSKLDKKKIKSNELKKKKEKPKLQVETNFQTKIKKNENTPSIESKLSAISTICKSSKVVNYQNEQMEKSVEFTKINKMTDSKLFSMTSYSPMLASTPLKSSAFKLRNDRKESSKKINSPDKLSENLNDSMINEYNGAKKVSKLIKNLKINV